MNINLTIIGQIIAFAFFVVFCMKYVWPPITAALAERKKKIAEGLDAADRAQRDLELAQEKAMSDMRKAKKKQPPSLNRLISELAKLLTKLKRKHVKRQSRLVTAAQAEIEQEANRAKEALRSQVAVLAVAGAEKDS